MQSKVKLGHYLRGDWELWGLWVTMSYYKTHLNPSELITQTNLSTTTKFLVRRAPSATLGEKGDDG